MKKIFASIGAVALGATAVHADTAAGMAMGGDNSKPWSVSATLRGFYDDNYTTASKGNERDSFGAMISPSIAFKFPMDQTTLAFRYIYSATWYDDRSSINSANSDWDQSHEFDALFSHAFSERYTLDAMNSFVIAQQPELIAGSGPTTFPYRTEGDNIRNHGEITFNGALTRQLSFVVGYQNTYYNYEDSGFDRDVNDDGVSNFEDAGGVDVNGNNVFDLGVDVPGKDANGDGLVNGLDAGVDASLSGLLDRMEHEALFNLRWQALPKTVLIGGYNFKLVDYMSDEPIAVVPITVDPSGLAYSKDRNSRSHIFYGGVDQNFTKDLILSMRLGAQSVDYYNDPANDSTTSPWGSLNLTYTYRPGSSMQIGFTHMRNQTDVVTPDATTGSITSDQQTSVLFASINHRFTPKLSGRLSGQWQYGEFFGGLYDGQSDTFLDFGANLTYRFNEHFSSDLGYNFSQLNSDIPGRDYDRNRVYLGVTASY